LAFDPGFTAGVRVAVGDVTGEGIPDIVVGPGPGGGPDIQVFRATDGSLLMNFMALDPGFTGGLFVAVGDVNADGFGDIIVGADAGGGPRVQVFSGRDGSLIRNFFTFDPGFTGGVRVAAGDVNNDGFADIITGAAPGGGPRVTVFSGRDLSVLQDFFATDPGFTGGLYVGAGDVSNDRRADIITGASSGGGPRVQVFDGATRALRQNFFAYDPGFTGGVRVAAIDFNADGHADIITGPGPSGGPEIRIRDGLTLQDLNTFFAFDQGFRGGVFVGGQ
jgi:hypothetical protein